MRALRIAARALALLALAGAAPELPEWEPTETSFGALRLRDFGAQDGPLVVCIHGMMNKDFIRNEWNAVAQRLAESGFHVLVPDFHSGPESLRPGRMKGEAFRELIAELALHHDGFVPSRYRAVVSPKVAVFGKSWGGGMAAQAGSLPQVVAVGLVVPAISESQAKEVLPAIAGRTALAMVRDDATVPFVRNVAFRQLLGDRVTFIEAATGGHKIVDDFVEPLAAFLEGLRHEFSHQAEGEELPEL